MTRGLGKRVVTLYLNAGSYGELKRVCSRLGVSVSSKVDEWIRKGLQESTGEDYGIEKADYEELKRAHQRLIREVDRIERYLKKRRVYNDLLKLAYDVSAKIRERDLSNIGEIAPKILSEWDGLKEDAHQFITLLETVRDKWEIERRLEETRLKRGQILT